MIKKERLYDAFGELIYVTAMADGAVQAEEQAVLRQVLSKHPWASEINWSFDYEVKKKADPDEVYKKAMQTFIDHGPDQQYAQLIDVLERVAAAYEKMEYAEKEVILNFQYEFKERLKKDLQQRELLNLDEADNIARKNVHLDNPVVGVPRERLYDAFGELIYVIAKADGLIQDSENDKLKEILREHPFASAVHWSFKYESEKDRNLEEIYQKAVTTLVQNGPDPEYDILIEILEEIAKINDGIDVREADVIIDLETDLTKRFLADLEKYKLKQ